MNYEKKYKEALEVAKRKLCFDKAGMVDSFTPNDIYEMFPELKENEDDRIRQELIAIYSVGARGNMKTGDIPDKDIVAWLEKQGEQKQEEKPRYNIGDVICDKLCTTLNKDAQPNMEIVDIKNGMYICDKGSFPVSQQDEYELVSKKIDTKLNDDSVSNELREASFAHAEREMKNQTFPDNLEFELIYTFEEGARWNAAQKSTWSEKYIADVFEKVGLAKIAREQSNDALTIALQDAMIELSKVTLQQKPTAWSKDDDDNIGMIESRLIDLLSYTRKDNSLTKRRKNSIKEEVVGYVNWLTSLEDRSTWKPSDAQINVLLSEVTGWVKGCHKQIVLESLYNDLKKLK